MLGAASAATAKMRVGFGALQIEATLMALPGTVVTGSPQNAVEYFSSSISVEYFESPPDRENWGPADK